MDKHKVRFPFSLWLPLLAVLLSAGIVFVPSIRVYLRWKQAIGNGDQLLLAAGEFQIAIPKQHLLRSAFEMNAMQEQGMICLLNAPGHLLGALSSQLAVHHAYGFPEFFGPFLWRVWSYPLFAVPAWFFAGRGIDGLLVRRRMRLLDLIFSAVLVLISLSISLGLRFGLSESERAGDALLVYYISGFAWWSLLFVFPLLGWVRQRHGKTNPAQ